MRSRLLEVGDGHLMILIISGGKGGALILRNWVLGYTSWFDRTRIEIGIPLYIHPGSFVISCYKIRSALIN
ncbi:hypothetical protein EX30DRAFT_158393 [Ascodesmis nigricans]|uniref:Uncharacterized protein n=1 Tax=Ascodesmis nigricans TaxID=341454 RepID=A0A4S2MSA5_9PEZI|nr:hypothetical protein EX30DRAFT_158393 [Ascodesmis nigricans]